MAILKRFTTWFLFLYGKFEAKASPFIQGGDEADQQPVTVPDSRQDSPLASEEAALDVGANNLVACTTTTGRPFLYDGRELFGRFHETTDEIARLQSKLREGRYSSKRIRRLYRQRTKRRDHAQNALVRHLVERLYDEGVATVYVGDLTDVLERHWSVRVNEKTHNFWAFKKFIDRLACVCEEYGISLEGESEAWTSQTCPECGDHEKTIRHGDTLTCPCGFEGHADLTASEAFLRENSDCEVRQMARRGEDVKVRSHYLLRPSLQTTGSSSACWVWRIAE